MRIRWVVGAVLLSLVLAGASLGGPAEPDTLVIVFPSHQGTLDGHFAVTTQDMLVVRNVYNALMKYKPDTTELTGDLAERWEVSPDGLVYTFRLRRNVTWQKGYGRLTAQDVKASFDRLRDPETRSPFAGLLSMVREIQVLDPYTIRFVLSEPYAPFLHLLTNYRVGPVVNARAARERGAAFAWDPVGTGPYEVERAIPRTEVVLRAFDQHFGGRPRIRRIITRTVPDLNAMVVGLENGQYHMLYSIQALDESVIKRLRERGFSVTYYSRNLPRVLLMNVTKKPLDDVRVRRAIAHAINRQQVIALSMAGYGRPWYSPVPEGYFAATTQVPRYEYNPEKARQLLVEAGYRDGLDLPMQVFDVMKVTSDVIAEQLRRVGIRVQQEVLDQPTFIQRVLRRDGSISFAVHCCVRQPDPDFYLSDIFSRSKGGAIYISGLDLEAELAAARRETNVEKRRQMYVALQRKIMENVWMIPLVMEFDRNVHVPQLRGMPRRVEALWGLDLSRLSFE